MVAWLNGDECNVSGSICFRNSVALDVFKYINFFKKTSYNILSFYNIILGILIFIFELYISNTNTVSMQKQTIHKIQKPSSK